jgi:muramidase (phage lysozyme)
MKAPTKLITNLFAKVIKNKFKDEKSEEKKSDAVNEEKEDSKKEDEAKSRELNKAEQDAKELNSSATKPEASDAEPELAPEKSSDKISDATTESKESTVETKRPNILRLIYRQTKILSNTVKDYEKRLYEQEQAKEAAQAERFIEGKSNAKKVRHDGTEEDTDKKESSLLFTIAKNVLGVLLVFLPVIMKFLPQIKEVFSNISTMVQDAFKVIFKFTSTKIEELLNKHVFDPLKDFFGQGVTAVWDMFISSMEEGLSVVVDAFKSFISDDLMNELTEGKYSKQEIEHSIEVLQKSGYNVTTPSGDAVPVPSSYSRKAAGASGGASQGGTGGGGASGGKDARPEPSNTLASAKEIPPEGRALLDAIAQNESGGRYDVIVGMGKEQGLTEEDKAANRDKGYDKAPATFTDFSKHPGIRGMRTPRGFSTAAGRYQFTETTWNALKNKHSDLTDFSPENQDKAAWYLIQERYKGDVLKDLQEGKVAEVGRQLNRTWTSLAGGVETSQSDKGLASIYEKSLQKQIASTQTPATPDLKPADMGASINEASVAANVDPQNETGTPVVVTGSPSAQPTPKIESERFGRFKSMLNTDAIAGRFKEYFAPA